MADYRRKIPGKYQNNIIYKRTFVIDELSIILAFISAVTIRYRAIINWVDYSLGVYLSMIITVFLFEIIVYFSYDAKRLPIVVLDPIDNLVKLVKSRALLIGLSVAYLFATQKSVLASRKVVIYFMALSVVYGYILRMLYRRHYIKKWGVPGEVNAYIIDDPDIDAEEAVKHYESGDYDCVVIDVSAFSRDSSSKRSCNLSRIDVLIKVLEKHKIRTFLSMNSAGYTVRPGIVIDVAGYATIPAYIRDDKFQVFGINYSIARVEEAVLHVINHLSELKGKYICFSNVHTTVMAKNDKEYADILNGAAFLFPDGTPIANREKNDGYIGAERVAGPDFMSNMFRDTQDGKVSHYFYGSTDETLTKLRVNLERKYPGLNIKGMYSPPFRALSPEEDEEDIKRINDSGADIVWIGLGAPKQEKWMKAHEGKVDAVMMGVGAGFDFHAGTAKRAPLWVQRIGLEWLFRLFTDPKRLFKRYFATNIEFIWSSLWDKLKVRNK